MLPNMKIRPDTSETLVMNLRGLMRATGIKKQALAKKSGVSERMIGYILAKERKPTIDVAEQLAGAFGLTGWQLIMPGLPVDFAGSSKLKKLVENYSRASTDGRAYIDRVSEQEVKYKKAGNDK